MMYNINHITVFYKPHWGTSMKDVRSLTLPPQGRREGQGNVDVQKTFINLKFAGFFNQNLRGFYSKSAFFTREERIFSVKPCG